MSEPSSLQRNDTLVEEESDEKADIPPKYQAYLIPNDSSIIDPTALRLCSVEGPTQLTFGRNSSLGATYLADAGASKTHCRVFINDGVLKLEDLSTNGTFVGGLKVGKGQTVVLRTADVILFGKGKTQKVLPRYKVVIVNDFTSNEPINHDTDVQPSPAKRSRVDSTHPTTTTMTATAATTATEPLAEMEETLICGICQEIMHQVVSLMPCLHAFCGACFSGWHARSNQCPQCRTVVTQVSRNHMLGNLIDVFLKQYPERKRDEADLADLESRNKFGGSVPVQLGRAHIIVDSDENDDEDGESDLDDDDNVGTGPYIPPNATCIYCSPGHNYTCTPTASHTRCRQCTNLFPLDPATPSSCALCTHQFCDHFHNVHSSVRCAIAVGRDILRPFKDFEFHAIPPATFRNNAYELGLLREYLEDTGIRVSSIMETGMVKLERGEWVLTWGNGLVTGGRVAVTPPVSLPSSSSSPALPSSSSQLSDPITTTTTTTTTT
ncbi:hypothetical protein DFS34DRAFT_610031, partial [Phlyctochytrium arcticum]